ncbi:hypothetical protein LPB140_05445 [Sphingorhabdus lutea]|uniref:Rap1a immunity protein domain-containing protein n=1 Tax=Sphingorhabdus lutea TaxID=1913578 RepID=A0A1L3JB21_9SPHN|nr:hypothetical protein [Sphingorhabdus lutea]APG62335.1 hypothetical protein LPB140_05445 [Sphingorhabdus lutea]
MSMTSSRIDNDASIKFRSSKFGFSKFGEAKSLFKAGMIAAALSIGGMAANAGAVSTMSAETYLSKVIKLNKLGVRALYHREYYSLKSMTEKHIAFLRDEEKRNRKNGQRSICAPDEIDMTADDLVTQLQTIPASNRKRMSVLAALRIVAKRVYPC